MSAHMVLMPLRGWVLWPLFVAGIVTAAVCFYSIFFRRNDSDG